MCNWVYIGKKGRMAAEYCGVKAGNGFGLEVRENKNRGNSSIFLQKNVYSVNNRCYNEIMKNVYSVIK